MEADNFHRLTKVLVDSGESPTLEAAANTFASYGVRIVLGARIANDPDSYRYLAESIRRFPDQETLLTMMRDAGFEDCRYHNLTGGIVALHKGFRY